MYKTYNFDKIRSGMVHLYPKPEHDYVNTNSPGGFPRGKTAYVCTDEIEKDLILYINSESYTNLWPTSRGRTIFVSSESTLPRDAIRNSGYKITRNIENADYVIVPIPKDYSEYAFNIMAVYEEDGKSVACIYTLNWHMNGLYPMNDATLKHVKELIVKDLEVGADKIEFVCTDNLRKRTIWFLSKCEEHEMIAIGKPIMGEWISEDRVELKPSINISVDTLITWAASDSDDLLRKAIMQSDWKKYPFTVCSFLAAEKQYIDRGNGYFRDILGAIHFNEFNENKIMTDVTISPEDYQMAATWAMYQLGVKENGMTTKTLNNRQKAIYSMFLAQRTIVRPIPMQSEMSFDNIINSVKNMSR